MTGAEADGQTARRQGQTCGDPNCEWRIRYFDQEKRVNRTALVRTIGKLRKHIRKLEEELARCREKLSV